MEMRLKKTLLILFLLVLTMTQVSASELLGIKYKNIPYKTKISYNKDTSEWSYKVNSKNDLYFIKTKGFGNYSDYLNSEKDFAFTNDCEYDFIAEGMFVGYSNSDGMFYKFDFSEGVLTKSPLSYDEVALIFPEYRIIRMSEFSPETNALKIKKGFGDLKVIIFNDRGIDLNGYTFTTGNSEIENYKLSGFVNIKKKGMVQFAKEGASMKSSNWFVLLVR